MNFPFHHQQLQWMTALVDSRIELLNPLFRLLAYFDSPYFFFLLIPTIWIGFSNRWGLRMFYWLSFNSFINSVAKAFFAWPRPSADCVELGMFHPASFGFPSGGAQGCMFIGAILLYYWKTPHAVKKWAIALTYILLVSFSRLYLGVHYPIDILGGWIVALILAALCIQTREPVEAFLKKTSPSYRLVLSQIIPLFILFLLPRYTFLMGSVMGVGLGTYFSLKYRLFLAEPKNLNEAVARSVFAVTTLFLFFFLWPSNAESFLRSFSLSLFMSVAVSPAYKKLFSEN